MRFVARLTIPAYLIIAAAALAHAQQLPAPSPDSVHLGSLHREALAADPRQRQFGLLAERTDLRLRNLTAERLPAVSAEGEARYQSDVFTAPGGATGAVFPSPPKDTYDAGLALEQPIFEPSIAPRRRLERAALAESEAEVRTALHALRDEVNEAFFSAALLAERGRLIAAATADLEGQLREARVRVREGVALPSDTAAIRATLLQRRQDQAEVEAGRGAALVRLAELIKRPVSGSGSFVVPDLTAETEQARRALAELRVRPEYERFARTRDRLARQREVVAAERWPRVAAFGRAGYGRPGLNPINDSFDSYFVVGMRLRWAPWNWGSTRRERQALALEREIVAAEEAAFTSALARVVQRDLADIDRLDTALALDDQIVALRERVEDETRARFREGVVTASEFLDRSTDALEARLARATHRIEQVRARARLLTTLGLEIR